MTWRITVWHTGRERPKILDIEINLLVVNAKAYVYPNGALKEIKKEFKAPISEKGDTVFTHQAIFYTEGEKSQIQY